MKQLWLVIIAGIVLLHLTASPVLARDIYLTTKNGVTFFTDYPLNTDSRMVIKEVSENFRLPAYIPFSQDIQQLSDREGLDPNFVAAVIKAESNFNPQAVSPKGAMGLMQLMPHTAQKYNVQNPFNSQENLAVGTKVLKNLLGYYRGDQELALAAYNAGHNAVKKYAGVPPYRETKKYINKVMDNYQNYRRANSQVASAIKYSPRTRAVPKMANHQKIYRIQEKDGGVLFTNIPSRI